MSDVFHVEAFEAALRSMVRAADELPGPALPEAGQDAEFASFVERYLPDAVSTWLFFRFRKLTLFDRIPTCCLPGVRWRQG